MNFLNLLKVYQRKKTPLIIAVGTEWFKFVEVKILEVHEDFIVVSDEEALFNIPLSGIMWVKAEK